MNYTFDAFFLVPLRDPLSLAFILLFGFSPNELSYNSYHNFLQNISSYISNFLSAVFLQMSYFPLYFFLQSVRDPN